MKSLAAEMMPILMLQKKRIDYAPTQVDRSVIVPDQMEKILTTYRDSIINLNKKCNYCCAEKGGTCIEADGYVWFLRRQDF